MRNYKELEIWKKSKDIVIDIYKVTSDFPKSELYGLTSQIRRAGISISANIAEGNGKNSDAELARFINISIGSSSEVEALLIIANELEFISNDDFNQISNKLTTIRKMLYSFLKRVNSDKGSAKSQKPKAKSYN